MGPPRRQAGQRAHALRSDSPVLADFGTARRVRSPAPRGASATYRPSAWPDARAIPRTTSTASAGCSRTRSRRSATRSCVHAGGRSSTACIGADAGGPPTRRALLIRLRIEPGSRTGAAHNASLHPSHPMRYDAMPTTYTDLIADVRKRTKQVSLEELKRRLEAGEKLTLLDVREKDEWRAGYIPGAISHPARLSRDPGRAEAPGQERAHRRLLRRRHALGARRGDARRARVHPRRDAPTPASSAGRTWATRWRCRRSSPTRSASATRATSCSPRWARSGRPSCSRARCCSSARAGSGRPAALYLAAAGVGTLGIVDADVVDASNLQRQILHATSRVGTPKVESAAKAHRRPEPRREGRAVPGAADERERRAHLRRLRGRRRRDRQLPDALPRQRRQRLHGQARRARVASSASTGR